MDAIDALTLTGQVPAALKRAFGENSAYRLPRWQTPRRTQSSSARKMWAAVQALQTGRLVSRSPNGTGTFLSG
jgi:hypothetical protein